MFDVAGYTLNRLFRDGEGNTEVRRYPELVRITEAWFDRHMKCHGGCRPQFLKWRQFAHVAAEKIYNAVARSLEGESGAAGGHQSPILDAYNPEGSTNHVDFTTSKKLIFTTTNSPVTHVVGDSEWELAFAERLEQMDDVVLAYVKNYALHFEISYWWEREERRYRPDYLLRLVDGVTLIVEVKGLRDN